MNENANWLVSKLQLKYQPVGMMFADSIPEEAVYLKKSGTACIAPLIFSAAKGKTVAIDKNSTGYGCSAFYLGYADWIFDGIEYFLSNGPVPTDRECERFIKTPALAKEFVESYIPKQQTSKTYIFKPLLSFKEDETPETVLFFANPDQLSALVFLIQHNHPLDFDRIKTGFASACMAMATIPLKYARNGESKAFWGLHDLAVRMHLPKDIMSMAMPYALFEEICALAPDSFLVTETWKQIEGRLGV
ncbi:MAG: DUF169 domain-containing protein [Prolixibacteraceae bacterium]